MTGPLEQIADKYDVLGQLGESGTVEVYKVRHRFLDEVRLLKVIHPPVAITEAAGESYLKEARQTMRLRHPNIAQLFDFTIDDSGCASLVTEALEGLTLEEALAELGRPPLPLALEIAQQALRAIGYLHRSGMIHRDVSPGRLCLTRDLDGQPAVKWVDLGVARILAAGEGGLPMAGLFPGQPRYAAPEQFGAGGGREPGEAREADARSDLYSFGVLLYELLTGRCPIAGSDPFSYMAGHLSAEPLSFAESDPEGALPEALRQAVLLALAKDPAQRVRSADDLARRLAAVEVPGSPAGDYVDRTVERARERDAAALRPVVLPPKPKPVPASPPAPPPPPPAAPPPPVEVKTVPVARPREAVPERPAPSPPPPPIPPPAPPAPFVPRSRAPSTAPEPQWDELQLGSAPRLRFDRSPGDPDEVPALAVAAVPPVERGTLGGPGRARAAWIAGSVAIVLLGALAGWALHRWGAASPPASPPPQSATAPTPAAPSQTAPAPTVEVAPASAPPTPTGRERAPVVEERQDERRSPRSRGTTSEFELAQAGAGRRARREPPTASPTPPAPEAPFKRGDLIPRGPGVEEAEPTTAISAPYPEPARGSGRSAKVRVALLVDENGNVQEARVQEGDHSGLGFNEAAVAAAKRVRFLPATKNGIPGKFWTELIYEFEPPAAPPAPSPPTAAPPPASAPLGR